MANLIEDIKAQSKLMQEEISDKIYNFIGPSQEVSPRKLSISIENIVEKHIAILLSKIPVSYTNEE